MWKKIDFWLVFEDECYIPTSQTGSLVEGHVGPFTSVMVTSPPRTSAPILLSSGVRMLISAATSAKRAPPKGQARSYWSWRTNRKTPIPTFYRGTQAQNPRGLLECADSAGTGLRFEAHIFNCYVLGSMLAPALLQNPMARIDAG